MSVRIHQPMMLKQVHPQETVMLQEDYDAAHQDAGPSSATIALRNRNTLTIRTLRSSESTSVSAERLSPEELRGTVQNINVS